MQGQALNRPGIVSGPMLGQVELRTATIWLEVSKDIRSVTLLYWKEAHPETSWQKNYEGELGKEFNLVQLEIGGLDFNSRYNYQFVLNHEKSPATGSFRTKDLWQGRKPAPDFNFLSGSCAYFNEPVFFFFCKPHGGDSFIFDSMAADSSVFMLWLGDNWYTRKLIT